MEKEYVFQSASGEQLDLDSRFETSTIDMNTRYVVSNIESSNCEIYAPEMNYYFQNSVDEDYQKLKSLKKLYNTRASQFDFGQDIELSQEVNENLLLVSDDSQGDLINKLIGLEFLLTAATVSEVKQVKGSLGDFSVILAKGGQSVDINVAQIIWFGTSSVRKNVAGIYDPENLGLEKTVEIIKSNVGIKQFNKQVTYSNSVCQANKKRTEVCTKCIDVCEANAIEKNIEGNCLDILYMNCNGCGRCVGICPTGALDYAPMPTVSFNNIIDLYSNSIALVVTSKVCLEEMNNPLQENILPLVVDTDEFLHECHLVRLLQTTGHPVILYTDHFTELMGSIISTVNEIFAKKYSRKVIFVCTEENELNQLSSTDLAPLEGSIYKLDERGLKKREVFSARISHVVGENDFGSIETGPFIHYGNLKLDQDVCTLCLSCADACSIGALTAHQEDNTLRYNPSHCTSCGYCVETCPETNCLELVPDMLSLNPEYFTKKIVAQDELFKCSECGEGFAPAKSIGKIVDIMTPLFGDDDVKIKTLTCCPDCKAKIMLESMSIENIHQ